MKLTDLEKKCLRVALEYSLCDYEHHLEDIIGYGIDAEEIKDQRQMVKGMQRVQTKLLKEIAQ